MQSQSELIVQSVRPSTGRNGPVSAPPSQIKHCFDNGENSKNVPKNSTFNRDTKSADELHAQRKHKLTSDEMRRFYSRERHPSNGTHDSFESTGSTGSIESTTGATINDSTYQTNSCNSSPKTLSRESSVDSVRSC